MNTLRQRLESAFETLGHGVYRHRLISLLAILVALGALLSQLPKIQFDTSTEGFFHKDDPAKITYDRFREQFGRDEIIVVAVQPPEVFDKGFLIKLDEFHSELEEEVPYLDQITSLINARNTRGEADRLIVEDLLETIPETPEGMAELKERVLSSPLYPNLFISEDGRFTTLVIETMAFSPEQGEEDLAAGFEDEETKGGGAGKGTALKGRTVLTNEENRQVVRGVERVAARFKGPDFRVFTAGSPVWGNFLMENMPRDMGRFISLAIVSIGIFLLLLFRRFTGVLMPLLVVILSLVSTIALMAMFGVAFTVPTTILPSFLLAVGVGASVHLLSIFFRHFQAHGNKEESLVYALGHSGLPILMTGLTTAAGLFAFATADLAPVAHLGIFGGVGVLLSLVYTLLLVPSLIALLPLRTKLRFGGNTAGKGVDRILRAIAAFSVNRAKTVTAISIGVIALAAAGLPSLQFSHNPVRWIPQHMELRQGLDLIDKELRGSSNMEILVNTGRENGLYEPAVLNGMEKLSAYAYQYPGPNGEAFVGKTNSVVDVLKETNRALNENRSEYYRLPQERELIAQELLLFENSGSDDLEKMVDSQFSQARLTVKMLNADAAAYVGFVKDMEEEANSLLGENSEITVTGILKLFTEIVDNLMWSMVKSYSIALVVITLMMILLMGSYRIGILTMVPNLAPIIITLGMMGWLGIPLDSFTLLIGSIALGLAVDDTIHFFHNFRRYYGQSSDTGLSVQETLLSTGRAMLFTTLVLVTGFWLFMFATLNNVFYFGLLTGTTLILALLSDFFLAPAMLKLIIGTRHGKKICDRWSISQEAAEAA